MKNALLFLLSLLSLPVLSQDAVNSIQSQANPFMQDANGRPLYLRQEYTAEGSPYYYEDYTYADVEAMSGKTYKDVKIRVNLLENQLAFQLPDGTELIAMTPIRSVTFYSFLKDNLSFDRVTLTGLDTPLNTPGVPVYELQVDGKAKLLNKMEVSFTDSKPYGSATITRVFRRKTELMALTGSGGLPVKIPKNREGVAALFGKDSEQVEQFIKINKLNCRLVNHLQQVFTYYNRL
ncbi:MAG: hypothetical protein EOO05_06965 [Chitinophagaceae bacterium]|nr:MAG: hypothetical protein EOO05_06965 [Chitinophagaceae bacterium]